ncbi:MAG: glycosyltransferase family 39 protein [Myxococcales bacterium]
MPLRTELADTWQDVAASFRRALPAILAFAVIRALGLWAVSLEAPSHKVDYWPLFHSAYDCRWYINVVKDGYDTTVTPLDAWGKLRNPNVTFFPLLPGMMWLVSKLGFEVHWSGLIVSWSFSLLAAWGIYAVGERLDGRRTGTLLALLWGSMPHSIVLSMAYTEGVFTALCAFCLLALLDRRWLTAALFCVLAGLTRPTGVALVAAVGVSALLAVFKRQDGYRPWLCGALCPLGFVGWLAWVGQRLGSPTGYFEAIRKWGSPFDFGKYTLAQIKSIMLVAGKHPLAVIVVMIVLVVAVVLFAWCIVLRQPLPLLTFSFMVLVLVLGAGGFFHSKARILFPAFPLLLPIAQGLSRAPRAGAYVTMAGILGCSTVYWVYLRLVWLYSP